MTAAAIHDADLAAAIERAGSSKSSFYPAMRLLPVERRHAMFAIYAFCRDVDDIADEPAPASTKSAQLDLWRGEIDAIYAGRAPSKPLARALVGPIRHFGLLQRDFIAVIDGMAMDAARDIRAPSLAELDLYCARVAGAVGRLSVRAFGACEPRADEVADHLGRALQLTNILRDLDEDAERERLYLPRELLAKHGIEGDDPATVLAHPALPAVCTDLAALARQHYLQADEAMAGCPRATMRPARVMEAVYRAQLGRMERRGWAAPRASVKIPKLIKLWIALSRGIL